MDTRIGTRRITARVWAMLAALVLLGGCAQKEETEIAIELPAEVPSGLELRWKAVRGADQYRMVFTRMTGAPVCTLFVAAEKEPFFPIKRDSLPDKLMSGWQLDMEMRAMKQGQLMAASGVRPLRIP
jgi:hypothetical protein